MLPFFTLFGPAAHAGDNYFGVSLNAIEYTEDGTDGTLDFLSVNGTLGQRFNDNIKGEMRFGVGIDGDEIEEIDIDLNNYFGVYIKAGPALGEQFFPYVILGYTQAKLEASAFGTEISETESGGSFGFGVDFSINAYTAINLEYLNYLDGDDWALDGFSFGVSQSF